VKPRSIAVVVVGDLARSPRMVNHARELARAGLPVLLIGYLEREFEIPSGVRLHALRAFRHGGKKTSVGWFAASGIRLTCGFIELLAALLREKPGRILVQNPPSFPTLAASWMAARILRVPLMIDWHNFGYTMLGLRLGPTNRLTRLAARYEAWGGRRAQGHFCVSEAMQAELNRKFQVQAKVLYDRPLRCDRQSGQSVSPVVAVCPSGWTVDEDMDLLFDALELLDASPIEFHLTGDGPRRQELESRIARLRRNGLKIHAEYLNNREYRALLQRAALGLSLHRSSSGVDLPMKIVDLFSAGIPVCALDYGKTLREQVSDGATGFLFRTAGELAEILRQLENNPALLTSMRQLIHARWSTTWTDEWERIAGPVFGVTNAA
jgi:beta-1,4-mannosyltransferase